MINFLIKNDNLKNLTVLFIKITIDFNNNRDLNHILK